MVYLVHSNSYDMNCFSFLSSNKESRTDVRLSLSCCPKKTSVLARDLHGAPDMVDAAVGQVKHIPFIKFNSNAGGKESLRFLRLPNGYGSVKKMSGKRRRPYAVRKMVGWHVNPETGKSVQEQITIGYAATRAEGLQILAEYNNNPFDIKAFASNRKILWSIIQNFVPSDFGMSMFCNKNRKKTPENRSFPGKRITFLSLAELRCATGGLQTVLG